MNLLLQASGIRGGIFDMHTGVKGRIEMQKTKAKD